MAATYALCVAVLFITVLAQPLPPCVDYPQHLALAAQTRGLLLGGEQGRLVPWAYNGLFELVVASLGVVLPIEVAGRLVLASALALAPIAVWRLVCFCQRPRVYAFAWLPFAYSLCFSWGFVNFILSVSLATLAVVAWLEGRSAPVFVVLSLLTGLAHVLGVPIVVAGALLGVLFGERSPRALAQLAPVVVLVAVAHATTDPPPHLSQAWDFLYLEWSSRLRLGPSLLGSWVGPGDEWIAAAAGAVVALTIIWGLVRVSPRRWFRDRKPVPMLVLGALAVYVAGPMALYGCWFFYQRAGYTALLWLPAVMPRLAPGRVALAQGVLLGALGGAATASFALHGLRRDELEDAAAIVDAVPMGARVAPVLDLLPNNWGSILRGRATSEALIWGHFPAYAVVRRRAEITWMFAREYGHFPVRQALPVSDMPQVDYAWSRKYEPDGYGRYFNHVLVRTGDPFDDPSARVFGATAGKASVLAHHGRFWLYAYEPQARPGDGAPGQW